MSYGLVAIAILFLATVALFLIFAWWTRSSFIELVKWGWFGFIFARLVALFLVAVAVRRLWRSFPRLTASVIAVAVISFAVFAVVKSVSPEGTYGFTAEIEPLNESPEYFPQLYHKDHFWRFSDGKMEECFGNLCRRYGRYEKDGNGWIVIQEAREPSIWELRFSVLGFRLVKDETHTEFFPRRITPFARPYWMPQWMQ